MAAEAGAAARAGQSFFEARQDGIAARLRGSFQGVSGSAKKTRPPRSCDLSSRGEKGAWRAIWATRIKVERSSWLVKIFTVRFGSMDGGVISFERWSTRVRLDEDTTRNVANLTHGQYFYAGSGTDLKKVYEALQSRLAFE